MLSRLLSRRRKHRLRFALRHVETFPGMRVLDLGCGPNGRSFSDFADPSWRITGVDLREPWSVKHHHPRFTYLQADMRGLPLADNSFDLVVSFGVLEHVIERYDEAVREIRRLAPQHIVMVPYKWAWFEPHFRMPFFGAWPRWLKGAVVHTLNLNRLRGHLDTIDTFFAWRSNAQYRGDFPDSKIKFMPTMESIAIIRGHPRA